MTQTNPMPEFDKPPVTEVALSVEFAPLEKWNTNLAILYGKLLQDEYPQIETYPPMPQQIEKFGEHSWQPMQVRFEVIGTEVNRFWYLSDPSVWLIQIQKDRFILNWRKVKGDEIYPRYQTNIRPRFEKEWGRFRAFIEQQKLGDIDAKQCEVTYVNDIVRGEEWKTMSEALGLITLLAGTSENQYLPAPESMSLTGSFLFAQEQGRLHIAVNHLLRQLDKKEVMQLRLMARGRPKSSISEHIVSWMDIGREWVVRGFTDMTTKKAHNIWGRKNEL